MDRMLTNVSPLFTDVTWGAGGSTADLSMTLAQYAHDHGHVANLHLTCTNMGGDVNPKEYILGELQKAKNAGIRNIVALRGDAPAGQDEWKAAEGGFTCALDLVEYIRANFNDYFGISVAGYPEGHPNAISEVTSVEELTLSEKGRCSTFDGKVYVCKDDDYKKEMDYLKKKVDAGAGAMGDIVSVAIVVVVVSLVYILNNDSHTHTHTHSFIRHYSHVTSNRLYHYTNVFRCGRLQDVCQRLSQVGHYVSHCAGTHVYQCLSWLLQNDEILQNASASFSTRKNGRTQGRCSGRQAVWNGLWCDHVYGSGGKW